MRTGLAVATAAALLAGCGTTAHSGIPMAPAESTHVASTPPPQTPSPAARAPMLLLWPAPADPIPRTRAAGLVPVTREHLEYHVHAHLDIFVNGRPVVVPGGVGINIHDPAVTTFAGSPTPDYGGIGPAGCAHVCISPLHTHGPDGILHTESAMSKPNTLGEFFIEWGVRLSAQCIGQYCAPRTPIAVYVDGIRTSSDPTQVQLLDHEEIAIVIGTPPSSIPSTADFSGA